MNPKDKAKTKAERLEDLKVTLRKWQDVENASILACAASLEKTDNPLVKLVLEILRQDSAMHRRVQQAILDSLEKEAFRLQPEELGEIWEMLEQHDEIEKQAIKLAEEAREHCPLLIQRQLLDYLIEDERKHDRLLGHLEDFKRGMYPYA